MPKKGSLISGIPKSTLERLISVSKKDTRGEKFDLQFSQIKIDEIQINVLKYADFVFIKNAAIRAPDKCIKYLKILYEFGGRELLLSALKSDSFAVVKILADSFGTGILDGFCPEDKKLDDSHPFSKGLFHLMFQNKKDATTSKLYPDVKNIEKAISSDEYELLNIAAKNGNDTFVIRCLNFLGESHFARAVSPKLIKSLVAGSCFETLSKVLTSENFKGVEFDADKLAHNITYYRLSDIELTRSANPLLVFEASPEYRKKLILDKKLNIISLLSKLGKVKEVKKLIDELSDAEAVKVLSLNSYEALKNFAESGSIEGVYLFKDMMKDRFYSMMEDDKMGVISKLIKEEVSIDDITGLFVIPETAEYYEDFESKIFESVLTSEYYSNLFHITKIRSEDDIAQVLNCLSDEKYDEFIHWNKYSALRIVAAKGFKNLFEEILKGLDAKDQVEVLYANSNSVIKSFSVNGNLEYILSIIETLDTKDQVNLSYIICEALALDYDEDKSLIDNISPEILSKNGIVVPEDHEYEPRVLSSLAVDDEGTISYDMGLSRDHRRESRISSSHVNPFIVAAGNRFEELSDDGVDITGEVTW